MLSTKTKSSMLLTCLLTLASCADKADFGGESQVSKSDATIGAGESSGGRPSDGGEVQPPVYKAPSASEEGIIGGHFDLDTAHLIYPLNAGKTDFHVHEYDDKYKTNGADFFKLIDTGLSNINKTISNTRKRFFLVIANAQLSPGAMLSINGVETKALSFQEKFHSSMTSQIYTLGMPEKAGDKKLTDLKIFFSDNVIQEGGLIPTYTSCVRNNTQGDLGEYRNGALIIQAIDAESFSIDPVLGVASGGLLWEATFFWHRDGTCYSDPKFVR